MSRPLERGAYRNCRVLPSAPPASIVPMRDFSGLASSICALASAPASAAMDGLDRCMTRLRGERIKTDGARFGSLGPNAMPDRFFRVLRHQAFELGLGLLMRQIGRPGPGKDRRKLRPGIGRGHVDDAHGFNRRLRRFDAQQLRLLATLHTAPELAFGRDDQVLIERIGMSENLDPFTAPGYH